MSSEVIQDIYEEAPASEDRVVEYRSLRWHVLKGVFAPYPTFRGLAPVTAKNVAMFNNKSVLDLGSGSGVRAVIAGLAGARSVVATDISHDACRNTIMNANRHNTELTTICTDMFGSLATKFDTVVSYLPSRDAPVETPEDRAIHDPNFELNFKLIDETADYLNPGGELHTAFLDQGQVVALKDRIKQVGYKIGTYTVRPHETGDWHFVSVVKP